VPEASTSPTVAVLLAVDENLPLLYANVTVTGRVPSSA